MLVAALLYLFKDQLFTIEEPFLYVSWWSFLTGFVVAIIVSLFTTPYEDKKLFGLVYGLADKSQTQ